MAVTAPLEAPGLWEADEPPRIAVVVPVHNEERGLATNVRRLHRHLARFPFPART